MTSRVWLNDELVDASLASINVFDHGFTVADGVFETLKIVDGKVFALSRHLERLQNSANILGLGQLNIEKLEKATSEVLAANPVINHGRMRITISSGQGPLGSDRLDSPLTEVVAISQTDVWPQTTSIVVVPWVRNERSAIVGAKSTSYAENVVALNAAHAAGFSEAIFTDSHGRVSEGTGTNIFIVSDSRILTPSTDTGLLQGITRSLVIEWASERGYDVTQTHFTTADLLEADEIFITSSTRDVHPVTDVGVMATDGKVVSRLTKPVGRLTLEMQNIFAHNSRLETNP